MAPERMPCLAVLDLGFENGVLKGSIEYYEAPSANEKLRVRWDVESQPSEFFPVGGGVAYVYDVYDTGEARKIPPSPDAVPTSLGDSLYIWSEGGVAPGKPWLMFVLILPKGYTLAEYWPEYQPMPRRAKPFRKDRLALFWILEGDDTEHAEVEWRLEELKETLQSAAQRINRSIRDFARSKKVTESRVQEEAFMIGMVDPMTVISTVSAGLALVDRFVDIVRKMRGNQPKPFRVQANQEAGTLVIKRSGDRVERLEVSADRLHLNEWDQVRYKALESKVRLIWGQFNALDAELPTLAVDEKVRIRQKMDLMRQDLCPNFWEMINIYEKTLGISLTDHYTLYETCQGV